MSNQPLKNEYEGYFILNFNYPKSVNLFFNDYHCYVDNGKKQDLQGLFYHLPYRKLAIFDKFECIIMQREPHQESVFIYEEQYLVKLGFVCSLKDSYFKNNHEANKQLMLRYIHEMMKSEIEGQYECQVKLGYLDVAADIQEE